MNEGSVNTAVLPAERYIIERPRLTKLLDDSRARIVLLVAPAGYGKTTLARQWLAHGGRRAAWYRATPASADVAALAAGLARATGTIAAGAPDALLRRIRALPSAEAAADDLAATLTHALSPWPPDAWLVIDDYHFTLGSHPAEAFVESISQAEGLQLLISARRRPTWATARRVLYGEVFELDAASLAFDEAEAASVLADLPAGPAAVLAERSRGWPAVVRLAAFSAKADLPADVLPPALHEYFAEELFRAASSEMQTTLLQLGALPNLDPRLLASLFGETADERCSEARELGFVTDGPQGDLQIHPLLQTFLGSKLERTPDAPEFLTRVVVSLVEHEHWDDAFATIRRFGLDEQLPLLFERGLDALLEEKRLSTLARWTDYAIELGATFPWLDLVEAELARRRGEFDVAEMRALQAAPLLRQANPAHASAAYALAGDCCKFDQRPDDAFSHYRLAEELASSPSDLTRALWGQFMTAVQFEMGEPPELLRRLEALNDGTPTMALRIGAGMLLLTLLEGSSLDATKAARTLLPNVDRVDDPLVTTSFLYHLGYVSVLAANYEEALHYLQRGEAIAIDTHVKFAETHFLAGTTAALIGSRQFKRAAFFAERLADRATAARDLFEIANSRGLLARLWLSTGELSKAIEALGAWESTSIRTLRYELAALQSIALAASGRGSEAVALARAAREATSISEVQTLALLGEAVAASGTSRFDQAIDAAENELLTSACYDGLVVAYRAHPPLLDAFRHRARLPVGILERVVTQAHDRRLAASLGWHLSRERRTGDALTPREQQVYELMCKGFTNKEIASQLFISQVTVKVHVRHILKKFGVRSRTEAVLVLQPERD